jgi:hypothetical protein
MLTEMPRDRELAIPDPAAKGHRPRMRGRVPHQRVYLYYEVCKGQTSRAYSRVFQTDYVNKWSKHDIERGREDSGIVALRKQQALAQDKGATT